MKPCGTTASFSETFRRCATTACMSLSPLSSSARRTSQVEGSRCMADMGRFGYDLIRSFKPRHKSRGYENTVFPPLRPPEYEPHAIFRLACAPADVNRRASDRD